MKHDDIRAHLTGIYERHGKLTPDIVLEEVRDKNHPLHGFVFDRSKADAADAWYRERAHELIRTARITYQETPESTKHEVRAFHCVRLEQGHVYEPAERVAADPFLRTLVLANMEREWRQLEKKYEDFEEFITLIRGSIEGRAA